MINFGKKKNGIIKLNECIYRTIYPSVLGHVCFQIKESSIFFWFVTVDGGCKALVKDCVQM